MEIDIVMSLRATGKSYGEISKITEMPKSTVASVCKGFRRCQIPLPLTVVSLSLDVSVGG